MTEGGAGSGGGSTTPVVTFGELKSAQALLKSGDPVPAELRPAVAQLVRSAAKRRWGGVVWGVLAVVWLARILVSHLGWLHWGIGVAYAALAVVTYGEPQRTIAAARRVGMGPVTRWGWPR